MVLHIGFGGKPGEQTDLKDLSLYANQTVMVETVLAMGKPVILVLFTNLPVNITALVANPSVKAIVQAYYPQHWGGQVLDSTTPLSIFQCLARFGSEAVLVFRFERLPLSIVGTQLLWGGLTSCSTRGIPRPPQAVVDVLVGDYNPGGQCLLEPCFPPCHAFQSLLVVRPRASVAPW